MWTYWLDQQCKLVLAHVDWAIGAPRLKRRFFRRHGYPLNLENPQTFSEKIQWRKLRDANPIFPTLSNKYLVRAYVADRLGKGRAQDLLVPLLQFAEDPSAIDFSELPAQFVLKATHGSGMNLIVEDASQLDQQATRALMRKWLMTHYRIKDHEWIYTKTPRAILAEARVAAPEQLVDVKISFFDGQMTDYMIIETINGTRCLTFMDASSKPQDVRQKGLAMNRDARPPPALGEMIKIGEVLSAGLDFVRVDFMCTPDRFYIGEMTLLTGSGLVVLDPASYHRKRGTFWTLPDPKTTRQSD
ncbi:ATP-grasp fold amidoligase family protein [Salibaculum halophilum]|uniref:ATP-grasp fold amidoligase family protein n=1 Tax=Salibaculum halophilum TaxID=1914408 RepID=UPI0015C44C7D|nr:ATP-grasp fold amidoligase family protein [Salibaculum halophilum]